MSKCKRCGSLLSDNSRFCNQCGAPAETDAVTESTPSPAVASSQPDLSQEPVKYCGKCGARLPGACVYCLICGTKAGQILPDEPPEPVGELTELSGGGFGVKSSGKYNSRLIAMGFSICILLVFAAAALWVIKMLPYWGPQSTTRARGAIIYVKNDESLWFHSAQTENPESLTGNFYFDPFVGVTAKASSNGRYIAYLSGYDSGKGTLFLRDFGQKPTLDAHEPSDKIIAQNCTGTFFFTGNSTYLMYLTAEGNLYACDFLSSWQLDGGVSELIDYNDNQALYAKTDDSGYLSVYVRGIAAVSAGKTAVGDHIAYLADWTPAFDRFVYVSGQPGGSLDIIARDLKLDASQTIAMGVNRLIQANAKSFTALYQTVSANPLRYEDVINDDLERSDNRKKEPDIADYPLLADFYENYGEDGDYSGSMDYEELVEENNQFQEAVDAYVEKLARDQLREDIHQMIEDYAAEYPVLYGLHLYRNGTTARLAERSCVSFENATLDADNGFVIWPVTELKNFRKIRISQYWQILENNTLAEYLDNMMSESIFFHQFGHTTAFLYQNENRSHVLGWQLSGKNDGVFFAVGTGSPFAEHPVNSAFLYYAPVANGTAGPVVLIDEEVFGIGQILSGGRLLYYKDMIDGLCDLYLYDGSSHERIGGDITLSDDYFRVEGDGRTVLYCEHYSVGEQAGDLFMYAKQNRQLAADVYRFYYRNDSLIYFLRGHKDGKADLYCFGSDGLVLIDTDVAAVLE